MGYRENVQQLCDELGIENPIREEDLTVEEITFFNQGKATLVEATDMNRAGRLFFQRFVDRQEFRKNSFLEGDELKNLKFIGQIFFAENWLDAEKAGRPMLIAFKSADDIVIHWR